MAASTASLPLVLYYHRLNRFSVNALAGALDADPESARRPVHLARNAADVKTALSAFVDRSETVVLGLSLMTPQLGEMRRLLDELRAHYGPRFTTVAGGPHATADPEGTLASGADIVVRGEAEATFPLLLQRLVQGRDCTDLPGTAFRQNGEIRVNPRADPVDIDAFPSFSPGRWMFGPIEITRGCPFACSFCQTSQIFGTRPRHRSIEKIVGQAGTLRSRNRKVVRLLSPNAFSYGSPDGRQLNITAMRDLLAALRKEVSADGRIIFGHFPSEVRPEHVTPETLGLLQQYADNDEIVIGAQSGSRRVLEACRRSHTAEAVLAAVSLARKSGYKVIVDFIFGLPGETAEDIRETVSVIEELSRMGARVHPHAFMPLPQTAFGSAPPGKISSEVVRLLEQLDQRRALYGRC
jgi:B12-binding domain/radical SAM domain protein